MTERRQRGMKARREKVGRSKQMLDDRWQREGIEAGRKKKSIVHRQ
jgi:hypothetical protein